ncbi:DUF1289 domain-containing protein [Psychrosphaera sp. B3R10]|uniref:DUF1289 domain-containing protein n=1 Tax=unclassified Psychrosphaera TaxID=2641570 RepID=UPI001C087259|nr:MULTISPECIES: DUF1289 domain-containing protein [unclassified Psychrosphaera]MBU2881111.1 DUF1289 domain-containing protein [Psychrosphaera sp. I2R16]MBU2990035.1 DUF1289 domain-containing protein [Psychrosphaera sp. B3R10]
MTEITSPCIRNCCLNAEDVCLGCFRTITEICAWTSYTNKERENVLAKCGSRQLDMMDKQEKSTKVQPNSK